MKLQILSDLHREFYRQRHEPMDLPWRPSPEAGAIVLAGDIDYGEDAADWLADEAKRLDTPIVYVPGNHEFYGSIIEDRLQAMRERLRNTGVHLLDCNEVVIDGTRFLGSTMWTDYQQSLSVSVPDIGLAMFQCGRRMADHLKIRTRRRLDDEGLPETWMPIDAAARHAESRAWLSERLSEQFSGPTVVITHHAPSAKAWAAQRRYACGDGLAGAYWSDMSDLFDGVDLWVFGHLHATIDVVVESSGMRLVSNPGGYPGTPVEGFDMRKIVEV